MPNPSYNILSLSMQGMLFSCNDSESFFSNHVIFLCIFHLYPFSILVTKWRLYFGGIPIKEDWGVREMNDKSTGLYIHICRRISSF